nr:ethylene-responsive transcription factor ERF110-like [Ipomoea batatas]
MPILDVGIDLTADKQKGGSKDSVSPMFSGLDREHEMSVMVSALTDVVAGRRPHPTAGENWEAEEHRQFLESSSVDTVCSSYHNFSIANTASAAGGYSASASGWQSEYFFLRFCLSPPLASSSG